MKVELIYDADCPNVAVTRSLLIEAFTKTGTSARWREWERNTSGTPAHAKKYGSPTILVDGQDVAGMNPGAGEASCRVYRAQDGSLSRTPTLETISAVLLLAAGHPANDRGRLRTLVASLPAIGAALLPKLTCPICWPAYSALLSAIGLGFVDYTPYLLPATLAFLVVAVGSLAIGARRTGRPIPLVLGITSSALVLIGKFVVDSDWMTNAGIALLVGAIFLAARRRAVQPTSCPACAGSESEPKTQAH
ncbi:MAG TPA: MerC family mercury resistance protein [Burkholderiales bacterium]|jgi:hypothetical protein|nr:MerC family mercury resistance protein [Burkholderiales bacterium]